MTTHIGSADPAIAVSIASEIGAVLLPIRVLTLIAANPAARQIAEPLKTLRSIHATYHPRCHAHQPRNAVAPTSAVM